MHVQKNYGQCNENNVIILIFEENIYIMQHNGQADVSTLISLVSAVVTISSIQPIVSLIAGLVAIVSGIFAIRYYHLKTKDIKDKDNG